MRVVTTLAELRHVRSSLPSSFGLVPTMGALHAGHAALVRRARDENASVGVSVFVNPSQFAPSEDLSRYPRPIEADLALLSDLGTDVVWAPPVEEIYPPGFQTWVDVDEVSRPLEGGRRPGHFRGVATVVAKLLNAFSPDRAYFGQKDAQQVAVIRAMVRDLAFPLDLVVVPTVREEDGLALSSRNVYLSPAQRRGATVLFRALSAARTDHERGIRSAALLRERMKEVLASEEGAVVDYVSVADPGTLRELETVTGGALLSLAVRFGATRLIDNFLLERGVWSTGTLSPPGRGEAGRAA